MILAFSIFDPNASKWDEEKILPVDALRAGASFGFAAIYAKPDFGGTGLTRLDASLIFEQLSMYDPSTTAYISIHNMCAWMIDTYGSDELRVELVPKLASMELFASYCLKVKRINYSGAHSHSGLHVDGFSIDLSFHSIRSPQYSQRKRPEMFRRLTYPCTVDRKRRSWYSPRLVFWLTFCGGRGSKARGYSFITPVDLAWNGNTEFFMKLSRRL
jgi:hypothetical protein